MTLTADKRRAGSFRKQGVAGGGVEGHPPLAPGQGWVVATTLTRVYERSAWIVPRKKGVV